MSDRQYLIPTQPGMGRALVNHDEKSKRWRATALLPPTTPEGYKPRRSWFRGRVYDQGQTPHCVAFTGKGILNTVPRTRLIAWLIRSRYSTDQFYTGAQIYDEWDGEAYDGTSGLGLCRYLLSVGIIKEFRWCFGLHDTLRTLSWWGPIGFGAMWKSGMMNPDSEGFIHGTGDDVGGHETEIIGLNMKEHWVEIANSWGTGWGRRGRARMDIDYLEDRLEDDGDAFVLVA